MLSRAKNKMKDKIINNSVALFNEFGVNKTSFRNIAASLTLSDGHVRYYFKTKESLLLAIFDRMNSEILDLAGQTTVTHDDIQSSLKNNLKSAFLIMVRYSFFFTEAPATFNQFTELSLYYAKLVSDRKNLFLTLFKRLKKEGFFVKSFSELLQEYAFYSIFIISDSWIRHYMIINNKIPDLQAVEFHTAVAFSVLQPYISEQASQ